MADDVIILEKTTPFQGYFRIDRYVLRHRTHAGGLSEPMSREIFERGHAVSVLLYDPLRDEVGLIEQFRPGAYAAGWEPWLIEVVAGIIDKGETPEQVAIREAKEEAGAEVTQIEPVCRYLVSPGGTTESMEIFCARVDSSKLSGIHGLAHEGEDIRVFTIAADEAIAWVEIFCARVDSSKLSGLHGLAHEGEDIRVFTISADEAISWVESGKIANSMTIIALQWLALNRSRLREKWLT